MSQIPSVEQQLIKLAHRRAEALVRRDAAELDALLGPEFIYTNSSGRVLRKAQYIESATSATWVSQQLSEVQVCLYGNTAVLTGKVHDRANFGGEELNADFRTTQVYRRNGQSWLYVAGHTSSPA